MKTKPKSNIKYWIWLQLVLGRGAPLEPVLEAFPEGPESIFRAGEREWRLSGVFGKTALARMTDLDLRPSYRILELCAKMGVDPLSPEDGDFPAPLRYLPDCPAVLYAKGDSSLLRIPALFAIVGTRSARRSSLHIASDFSELLTRCGMIIVSGAALGVDSAAHIGALNAGGKTIGVLGSPFGSDYLKRNESLRRCIAENGVLVTELAPEQTMNMGDFPKRNRLVSGMTCGTLVVEAAVKSGSLITATWANSQGKDVFAVPGEPTTSFQGSNELLEAGAMTAEKAWDILQEYRCREPYAKYLNIEAVPQEELLRNLVNTVSAEPVALRPDIAERCNRRSPQKKAGPELSRAAAAVYGIFSGTPVSLPELQKQSGLSGTALLSALSELEVFGYIETLPDKTYNYTSRSD